MAQVAGYRKVDERVFINLFYQGVEKQYIAEYLHISITTVSNYIVRLKLKLHNEIVPGGLPHKDKCDCPYCANNTLKPFLYTPARYKRAAHGSYAGPSLGIV